MTMPKMSRGRISGGVERAPRRSGLGRRRRESSKRGRTGRKRPRICSIA